MANIYSENTQEIIDLAAYAESHAKIDPALYSKWDVKRGLRDQTGKGVLTGLTHISDVRANKIVDGVQVPIDGELFYRGYNIRDLVNGFSADNRFGYEEVTYLLLFDKLPNEEELTKFKNLLSFYRSLPTSFVRDIIMKAPSRDMMNTLARSVLTLYSYDEKDDDISIPNVLRQSLQLISLFPLLSVYGYQAYRHYHDNKSLYIHSPKENLSTAENILRILRPDKSYTPLEARILDVALVLHMEHGGGNNSTFTTHVVTSTHTDTYSAIAAALGSLKGPRHGGANLKVVDMIADMKKEIKDWKDEDEVSAYLRKLLRGEAFDHQGLIYSTSDPRELIFKEYVEKLSKEKGLSEEFELYSLIEKLGPKIISQERHMFKGVCCNVDFYSGFVYEMLGIPKELFTPMFAVARIVGWSAHRIEELSNNGKIIRPAYKPVITDEQYVALSNR